MGACCGHTRRDEVEPVSNTGPTGRQSPASPEAEEAEHVPLSKEVEAELAKLSLQDLHLAFESLPNKAGQTYRRGQILKVRYREESHCNYSTSGFDADESEAWKVFLPVHGRGRDVGYVLDMGYDWESADRGSTDKEEFSAHVKLLPSGTALSVKSSRDREKLMAIVDELPELDDSAKAELQQIIQDCTKRR